MAVLWWQDLSKRDERDQDDFDNWDNNNDNWYWSDVCRNTLP